MPAGSLVAIWVLGGGLLLGSWVGSALSDTPTTTALVQESMRWLPWTVLGLTPFILARAVFDGLQKPIPGLAAAAVRTVLLVIPFVWFGSRHHDLLGLDLMQGVCAGFMAGTLISGAGMLVWAYRALRRMDGQCPVG